MSGPLASVDAPVSGPWLFVKLVSGPPASGPPVSGPLASVDAPVSGPVSAILASGPRVSAIRVSAILASGPRVSVNSGSGPRVSVSSGANGG